ncbi:MAG: hypothetical protein JWN65_1361 [Solirubrobacterales bacterium]|nr:hypothetical protein [Solirubrobacterales bacterium]
MTARHIFTPIAAIATFAALALPTGASAAGAKDRDHDHMPDRWEQSHQLNTHRNDAKKDSDHDGLRNLAEFRAQTDPRDADTDNDGIKDGKEQAGTITSFAGGVLTITLFDNSTISGTVDNRTEIDCAPAPATTPPAVATPAPAAPRNADDGDDESSDDQGGQDDGDRNDGPHGDEGDDESNCTTADLKPGARVDEAVLSATSTGRTFQKVELG